MLPKMYSRINLSFDFPSRQLHVQSNHGNTRRSCEIYSKLIIKALEQCQLRRYSVFIINFENSSHLVPVFPC